MFLKFKKKLQWLKMIHVHKIIDQKDTNFKQTFIYSG